MRDGEFHGTSNSLGKQASEGAGMLFNWPCRAGHSRTQDAGGEAAAAGGPQIATSQRPVKSFEE